MVDKLRRADLIRPWISSCKAGLKHRNLFRREDIDKLLHEIGGCAPLVDGLEHGWISVADAPRPLQTPVDKIARALKRGEIKAQGRLRDQVGLAAILVRREDVKRLKTKWTRRKPYGPRGPYKKRTLDSDTNAPRKRRPSIVRGGLAEGGMEDLYWLGNEAWAKIEPHLPHGRPGGPRVDDRRVISGILHVLRSGCAWRNVPSEYGSHKTLYNRYSRWAREGIWRRLFEQAASAGGVPDELAIDSTHIKELRSAGRGKKGGGNGGDRPLARRPHPQGPRTG
jgi:transposase